MTLVDTSHDDKDINVNAVVSRVIGIEHLKPLLPAVSRREAAGCRRLLSTASHRITYIVHARGNDVVMSDVYVMRAVIVFLSNDAVMSHVHVRVIVFLI